MIKSLKRSYRNAAFFEQFHGDCQRLSELSPEDREFAELLAIGKTTSDLARKLELGTRTIQKRRKRILDELGMRSEMELTELFARCAGAEEVLAVEAT